MTTATDPQGIVHTLAEINLTGPVTVCGENASGWSTFVTEPQRLGLVLFCPKCHEEERGK